MKHIKHWLATMAVLLCGITASAHDFEVGGIYYNITSEIDCTVAVTYRGSTSTEYYDEYTGEITIPATVTYKDVEYRVTSINSAFDMCTNLTAINIPEGVTSIGKYAFYCCGLTAINIPEGVTSIGEEAFKGCSSLTSITIPESMVNIENDAFYGCSDAAVYISSIEAWCKIVFNTGNSNPLRYAGNLYHNGELVTYLVIPESVTNIGKYAFCGCTSLTSVSLHEGITSIEDGVFLRCSNLASINIPKNVTSIGSSAFAYCSSLTSINIPKGVTSIGNSAFSGCNSLASITCYATTPPAINNYTVFERVDKSIPVYVPDGSVEAYESAGNWRDFTNFQPIRICGDNLIWELTDEGELIIEGTGDMTSAPWLNSYSSAITSVVIGEEVTSICTQAFEHCYNLSSITIPTSVTRIGEAAFNSCHGLTSVAIPNSVQTISSWTFANCSNLREITIPNSLSFIGDEAFKLCSSLTSITIPGSVYNIGNQAFSGCKGLTSIFCEITSPLPLEVGNNIFYNVGKSIPVYVPTYSISAYQAAEVWNEFENILGMPKVITISEYGSGTYCSEYALDFSKVEGLKAYAATGYDSETGIVTLTRVMTAKAGMGLFVKGEPGDYVVPTLESTSFNTLNMLVGTLEDVIVNGTDGLYTNYKYAAPDGEPLFYQFADGSTQKAGRAYLQIPTSWLTTTAAKSISYRFDDGETTDIENSEITTPNSEFIYDLYGRRVENPVKGGVYIVKGKKIVY